ncbi:pectinesterase family protein [Flavobacterium sp. J372]|uniref:pectinesterase family protein n=1 Tax=Flavobacterium sp. J372 TaxID=2898436 RepID=UPI002150D6EA|nr:pectinesterase family protein [Flavobacterium sp. J372]MCR5862089.1 pectinesterase family protein [Flavobacterium sp. J372]
MKLKVTLFTIRAIIMIACVSFSAIAQDKPKADAFYKIVAHDGSGDYTTIQAAIDDSKSFPPQRITIFIKNGTYHEKVKVHEWNPDITLIGESREGTVITYNDYFAKVNTGINSTFHTYTMLVEGDGFIARDLTIVNASGDAGQAVALSVHANNAIVVNCSILGNQDTLYVSGNGFRIYFENCLITGTTDFIFGSATAYFKSCTLHSLKNSYITAASTPQGEAYGFVFDDCRLTAERGIDAVYLGRPWRPYAKTVFINCMMDAHIKPEGWYNWNKQEAERTAFYAEYNCSGTGYKPSDRVKWSYQLTKRQAKAYTVENCLGVAMAARIKQLQLK